MAKDKRDPEAALKFDDDGVPIGIAAWDMQQGETPKAYAAFVAYRDLGPGARSMQKAADAIGKSWGTVRDWHDRWAWRSRAIAYDAMLEQEKRQAVSKAIQEMGERHATQGMALARAIMVPNQALLQRLAENPDEWRTLKNVDAAKIIELAIKAAAIWPNVMKAERLARGEATEQISNTGTGVVEHVFRADENGDYEGYLRSLASRRANSESADTPAEDAE